MNSVERVATLNNAIYPIFLAMVGTYCILINKKISDFETEFNFSLKILTVFSVLVNINLCLFSNFSHYHTIQLFAGLHNLLNIMYLLYLSYYDFYLFLICISISIVSNTIGISLPISRRFKLFLIMNVINILLLDLKKEFPISNFVQVYITLMYPFSCYFSFFIMSGKRLKFSENFKKYSIAFYLE